jgi:hypothetical protein
MENKEIKDSGLRIIAPGAIGKALEMVLPMLWQKTEMGLGDIIVLFPQDQKLIQEAVDLLRANPEMKMVVVSDKWSEFKRELEANLVDSPRVKTCKEPLPEVMEILKLISEFEQEAKLEKESPENAENEETIDPAITGLIMTLNTSLMGRLRHDLKPYVIKDKGDTYRSIITQARRQFSINERATDEQVVDFVVNSRPNLPEKMRGRIEGVYCDLDDTLMMRDGSINTEAVALLEKYETQGKRIFIWTGGNLEEARKKLTGTVLEKYNLVSKYDFTGATAEVVIDNVSMEKFLIQYAIKAERFVRI